MRILGLDIGSRSIKAVEIDSAFGRYEIHEYHEVPLNAGAPVNQALLQLLQSLPKQPDKIVTTLPTGQVTFRNLSLPTRDKKAIQSSVSFELEDELPFPEDQMAFDYSILNQTKAGTDLHVSATLKRNIAHVVDTYQTVGADPDLITTEAWAFRTLMNRILAGPGNQERPVALAHIGHERTVIYLHHEGKPVFIREINWGGRDLNFAICQKYQIPLDQAEHAKLDHGFVVPASQEADVTPEQSEFSATVRESLQTLILELKQAELSSKNLTKDTISRIYVSGGTSLLPGLVKVVEEELRKPVLPAQGLTSAASSGVTYSEHSDATFLLAAATALCLVGQDRASTINFRKGEFAKRGQARELNLSSLKRPFMAVGAIAACAVASLMVQSQVHQAQLKDLDSQLEKSMKSFFGQIAPTAIRNYLANPANLKKAIDKEIGKQRELAKLVGPNPTSPLDYLKELSATVPKDIVVDMTLYNVGSAPEATYPPAEKNATLTFIVANPQMAEKLASLLGGKMTNLQRSKMEEVPGIEPKDPKRWKITFTGKPLEDAYGK